MIGLEETFALGCGLAARYSGSNSAVMVVRLDDGRAAFLADSENFMSYSVLGITCDEIFVIGGFKDDVGQTILRIRLESLGAFLPEE